MALMTPQEYIESLRKLNTRVYMFGEKIENWVDHPMIRPSINVLGDATGALLVSKLEGDLNTEPFAENEDVSELNTGTETFE